jgi:hypothetical protein
MYQGIWKNAYFVKGAIKYRNGDVYKGEYNNNKRNGRGYFRTANGEYSGDWKNDLKHGGGSYRWANGD